MNTKKMPFTVIRNNNSGFTLVEIMIAIGIFAIGFLAVGMMQVNALNTTNSARHTTEAMAMAEDWVEQLRVLPFYDDEADLDLNGAVEDFDMHPDLSIGDHPPTGATADATPYTVRWTVSNGSLEQFDQGTLDNTQPTPRCVNIRVWVTPDNNANDIQAEIFFSKYWSMDRRL